MEIDAIIKCLAITAMAAIIYMLYYHRQAMKKFEEHWEPKDQEISTPIPQPTKRQKTEKNSQEPENLALQGHDFLFGTLKPASYVSQHQYIRIPAHQEMCVGTRDDIEIVENGNAQKRMRKTEARVDPEEKRRKAMAITLGNLKQNAAHYDINFHKNRREAFYAKLREMPNSPVKRIGSPETKKKASEIVQITEQNPYTTLPPMLSGGKDGPQNSGIFTKESQSSSSLFGVKNAEPIKKTEENKSNVAQEIPKQSNSLFGIKEETKTAPTSQETPQKGSLFGFSKEPAEKASIFGGESAKISMPNPPSSSSVPPQSSLFPPTSQKAETSLFSTQSSMAFPVPEVKKADQKAEQASLFSSGTSATISAPKLPENPEQKPSSLFGTAPASTTPSLFSNSVKAEETKQPITLNKAEENKSSFSLFGNTSNAPQPAKIENPSTGSLFGGNTLFGNKADKSAGGSLFGFSAEVKQNAPDNKSAPQTNLASQSSIFPSQTSNPSPFPNLASTSAFPSQTPAPAHLANQSSAAAQEPQIKNPLFGSSSQNLFGNINQITQGKDLQVKSPGFAGFPSAQPPSNSITQPPSMPQMPSTGSLFGAKTSEQATFPPAQTTTPPQSQPQSLFGASAGNSLFGSGAPTFPQASSGVSLFGASNSLFSNAAKLPSSLIPPSDQKSLFGTQSAGFSSLGSFSNPNAFNTNPSMTQK
ncbi:unnamed protein product [Blepharisma stoltei]|uniref:Uncharacterized protein n=1 Tax=Blepharisma stoltei TaxID=1481888 RepID=A0AAU9IZ93_9CILI|nr:unnamed protein product [Blepharisma stoltei]